MNKLGQAIVALDNMDRKQALGFLSGSGARLEFVKIGLEMFLKYGPDFVKEIHREHKKKIFLDLKLHDIPNTVAGAIHALKGLPIELLTIHLGGGRRMLEMAIEAADQALPQTKLLGVTYLTSLGEEDLLELWNIRENDIPQAFMRLFGLALEAKIHGVVLSSRELPWIKEVEQNSSRKLLKVCPGIRFQDEINTGQTQDQKRVETPKNAFELGATHLVIGRSLTQTSNLEERLNYLEDL